MTQAYLYLNSLLYLYVAVRTTLAPQSTATRLGYLTLSNQGRAEYLVVYGGLQIALALIFFLLARDAAYYRVGLLVSMSFYAPIVLYRVVIGLRQGPASKAFLGPVALETVLLAVAVWLYWRGR